MNKFQRAWLERSRATAITANPQSDEDVMRVIATRAAHMVGRELSLGQRDFAADALHYGFGAATGAIYAAVANRKHSVTAGFGSAFGSVFFAVGYAFAPEDLKPCVPGEQSPGVVSAAYEWLTHVVYGVTVEATRRALVRAAR